MIFFRHLFQDGKVLLLVELLPHSSNGLASILTSGALYVEFACSTCDSMRLPTVLDFFLHLKALQFGRLIGRVNCP